MFNAGLFGSDVDYGEECENIDKKRCRAPSRQSEQTTSWARYMEMRSTSLNSLMETKWYYKNWCLWKECHTPHLMVITTTVFVNSLIIIHRQYMVFSNQNKNVWEQKNHHQNSRSRHVTKMTRRHKKKPIERQLNKETAEYKHTSPNT